MSFGNSYNGGRTRMTTKVYLNVYDLTPANDYLFPIGLGLHHTGIEIMGREYSYGSGGGGIFESPPKMAPGARFRCQIELGSYEGGTKELNQALDELRSSNNISNNNNNTYTGGYGPNDYNLIARNCNHFCNALSWKLLRRQIPPYINRCADIGNCCSCLLPKGLLQQQEAPVGGTRQSFAVPTAASMNRGGMGVGGKDNNNSSSLQAFQGKGHSLAGDESTTTSNSSTSDNHNNGEGLWSRLTHTPAVLKMSTKSSSTPADDLTDRREKARKAALARLERNQQLQQQQQQPL